MMDVGVIQSPHIYLVFVAFVTLDSPFLSLSHYQRKLGSRASRF